MKFKYYLRGLGIGILISTIILSVSFAMKKKMTFQMMKSLQGQKELGMVMEDTGKDTIPKATETEDEIPKSTEGGFNTEQTDMQPGTTDSGEISQDVGNRWSGCRTTISGWNQYGTEGIYRRSRRFF